MQSSIGSKTLFDSADLATSRDIMLGSCEFQHLVLVLHLRNGVGADLSLRLKSTKPRGLLHCRTTASELTSSCATVDFNHACAG